MMSLGTYISIGLLVLCTATIAMAAGLKGWTAVHQKSDEAVRAACTGEDPFTLSGFAGNNAYDGCYMISRSTSNLRLYTRNGQDESLGGLIVSAPEHVDSTYLTYWTIREEGGNKVCGGSKFQTSVNGAHPTQVEKWKCYGGSKKDKELPVKPTLLLSCGCPNVDVPEVKEAVNVPEVEETVYVPEVGEAIYVPEVSTTPAHGLDTFLSASFVVALLVFSLKSCLRRTSLRRYCKPAESGQ